MSALTLTLTLNDTEITVTMPKVAVYQYINKDIFNLLYGSSDMCL